MHNPFLGYQKPFKFDELPESSPTLLHLVNFGLLLDNIRCKMADKRQSFGLESLHFLKYSGHVCGYVEMHLFKLYTERSLVA